MNGSLPQKLGSLDKRLPTVILFTLFCIIMALLISMYVMVRSINSTYPPRNHLISHIMVEVTESHLWFEEILSGDQNENVDLVLSKLEMARRGLISLEQGNEQVVAVTSEDQLALITEAQQVLAQFHRITLSRLQQQETSAAGSEIDQSYDDVFKHLMAISKSLSNHFLEDTRTKFAFFSNLQRFAIGLEILSFSVASLVMWNISRRRDEVYQEVLALNEDLDHKVRSRTDELEETISTMQQTQQQMIEQEKMAALGSMVAGVSHEVNTPLGVSFTAVTILQEKLALLTRQVEDGSLKRSELVHFTEFADETAKSINFNIQRCTELISSFKSISVDQTHYAAREINVRDYINEVLITLRSLLKRTNHSVDVICDPDLQVSTYPGILAQILTNLIQNSLKHGFEGLDKGKITILTRLDNEQRLLLEFSDNGRGVDEATLKHMFEPFVTTKRGAGGSGLGLAVVYNVVNYMQGSIECSSEVDKGLTYRILLPQVQADPLQIAQ